MKRKIINTTFVLIVFLLINCILQKNVALAIGDICYWGRIGVECSHCHVWSS